MDQGRRAIGGSVSFSPSVLRVSEMSRQCRPSNWQARREAEEEGAIEAMVKPDDADVTDRAKQAKEKLDEATHELDVLNPDVQARVLELVSLDKHSLELLLELLRKLKDGEIQPVEYRKLLASLQSQALSEQASKRPLDAQEKGKSKDNWD